MEQSLNSSRLPQAVLMYHSIGCSASESFRRYTVSPSLLEEHIQSLQAGGYNVSSALDYWENCQLEVPSDKMIVLTFDDGFVDFHESALPILTAARVGATVFVPAGYISGRARWLVSPDDGRALMSWSQLAEVLSEGIEVGSHGLYHLEMDRLDPNALLREVQGSKVLLEEHLGTDVVSFCYPFGYHNRRARSAVSDGGYSVGFGVDGLLPHDRVNRFAIPRILVDSSVSGPQLLDMLDGPIRRSGRYFAAMKRPAWKLRRQIDPHWNQPSAPTR